jgi:peroxiredoxin
MSEPDPAAAAVSAKPPRWRRYARDLAFVVAIVLGMHWVQTRHVPDGEAPPFVAPSAAGGELSLAEWRSAHAAGPVGLYFWADWCGICTAQQGSMDDVQADWPVLTVAMQSGDAAAVSQVLTARGLDWNTAVDADGRIAARYGLRGVPAFVVLDREGRIRSVSVGYTTEWGIRARLWGAGLMG